ncbi:DUF2971 domain-containing protein [Saccharicrinis sp. FJH62]|uniref:DUF2971 domain-containing protein n=1 Tax=Saccharicrinis sp. FJH62 TaxID=3344657 RepID=UPI0035D49DF8
MEKNDKILKFKRRVNNLFPGINFSQFRNGHVEEGREVWTRNHYTIPSENLNLIGSPYYYEQKQVVHFTNIFALNSILQEKAIRLYNLHNLNDPREFTFASKIFDLSDSVIKDAKDNLFIFSFCEENILNNSSDEFNMWRLYGKNGKGVALVFSVQNSLDEWNDFHLSKVSYGVDQRRKFMQLLRFLNANVNQEPFIDVDFGKLYAFHKSKMFSIEKEVRLVFDRREMRSGAINRTVTLKNEPIFPIIKSDLYKIIENKNNIRYLRLPIYFTSNKSNDYEVPLLKIEKIIVGYNYIDEVKSIKSNLFEICNEQLGYTPEIEQTRIKNLYWDIDTKKLKK